MMRRCAAALLASCALAVAACGGGGTHAGTTTSSTPTFFEGTTAGGKFDFAVRRDAHEIVEIISFRWDNLTCGGRPAPLGDGYLAHSVPVKEGAFSSEQDVPGGHPIAGEPEHRFQLSLHGKFSESGTAATGVLDISASCKWYWQAKGK